MLPFFQVPNQSISIKTVFAGSGDKSIGAGKIILAFFGIKLVPINVDHGSITIGIFYRLESIFCFRFLTDAIAGHVKGFTSQREEGFPSTVNTRLMFVISILLFINLQSVRGDNPDHSVVNTDPDSAAYRIPVAPAVSDEFTIIAEMPFVYADKVITEARVRQIITGE